jgi:hypothetical protein
MIKFVKDKNIICSAILEIIHSEYTDDDLARATKTWWVNIRDRGGLGLTETGYEAFLKAEIENYTFLLEKTPSLILYALELNKKIPCPYHVRYIKRERYITVYDTRVAVMIQLHGNVKDYLNTLENLYD